MNKNYLSTLTPAKRSGLKEALANYYNGLEESEAAEVFFATCEKALIDAHARGVRLTLPLQLKVKPN